MQMSNLNRSPVFIDEDEDDDDDDDDDDLLLEEINSESTAINQTNSDGYWSRSLNQPIPVAQLVCDDRPTNMEEMTNRRINDLILCLPRTFLTSTSDVEFMVPVGGAPAWTEESVFDYIIVVDHNEQSNGRITHPSDAFQAILMNLLSPVLIRLIFNIISNGIPFGVQDTQTHTIVLPVVNLLRTDVHVDNENGDHNEDATVYNDDVMNFTIDETVCDDPMSVRENMAIETTDGETNNDHTDINHRNEQSMEGDTVFETESQNDLINDNSERGQASPRSELNINNEPQDHTQANIPPTHLTSTTESSEQAEEIVSPLAGPTDNNIQTTGDPAQLLVTSLNGSQLNVHHQKESSPLNVHDVVDENKHIK